MPSPQVPADLPNPRDGRNFDDWWIGDSDEMIGWIERIGGRKEAIFGRYTLSAFCGFVMFVMFVHACARFCQLENKPPVVFQECGRMTINDESFLAGLEAKG